MSRQLESGNRPPIDRAKNPQTQEPTNEQRREWIAEWKEKIAALQKRKEKIARDFEESSTRIKKIKTELLNLINEEYSIEDKISLGTVSYAERERLVELKKVKNKIREEKHDNETYINELEDATEKIDKNVAELQKLINNHERLLEAHETTDGEILDIDDDMIIKE